MCDDTDYHLYIEGRSLIDAEDYEAAIKVFEKSLRTWPHFKTAEMLGICLMETGRVKEAVVAFAAATGLNKGVRPASLLANALLELGDISHARDAANLALERHATNKLALQVLEHIAAIEASRASDGRQRSEPDQVGTD